MIIDCYTNIGPGIGNHRTQLQQPMEDTTLAAGLIASMDRAGTAKAITFAPKWVGGDFVDPTYELSNAAVHDAVKANPDRLIGYARVNPNYGAAAVAELEKCFSTYGFKGLMLDPEWENFYPGDKKLAYPLYETALKYKAPVMFHSWYSPSQPALFWQVADDFPDLAVIIAHLGGRLFADATFIAQRAPNIYLETSDNMYGAAPLVRALGAERILYGSNTPFAGPEVEIFKITSEEELTEAQKALILGGNAARLHGLS
jgi:predicted TIM-barrel fold metal-dependent hydrolase